MKMVGEKCTHCPWRHGERGRQPCLSCLGDVPYEKLFDRVLGDLKAVDTLISKENYNESESTLETARDERKMSIIEEFFIEAQTAKFLHDYKDEMKLLADEKQKGDGRSPFGPNNGLGIA